MDINLKPHSLTTINFDYPLKRSFQQIVELTDFTYQLIENNDILNSGLLESRFNPFSGDGCYKKLDRTTIERIINQGYHYKSLKLDAGSYAIKSKGLELSLGHLNGVFDNIKDVENCQSAQQDIYSFCLNTFAHLTAILKFLAGCCEELITMAITDHISQEVKKLESLSDKKVFLLSKKASLSKIRGQFNERQFANFIDIIQIELDYVTSLEGVFTVNSPIINYNVTGVNARVYINSVDQSENTINNTEK